MCIPVERNQFDKMMQIPDKNRKKRSENNRLKSSTMQIPDEAFFEDVSQEIVSHLDISLTGQDPLRIPLNKDELIIGRDENCQVQLPLSNVSWNHARITCSGEEYVVHDLDSTNGTYVNNIRVSRCVLRNNDQIRIGEAGILFVQQKTREKS